MDLYRLVVPALDALGVVPGELQVIDVDKLAERYYPNVNTDRPALMGLVRDTGQCLAVRDRLSQAYPEDHRVTVILNLEGEAPTTETLALEHLGSDAFSTVPALLYVPPLACMGSVEAFQNTVAHLRAPEGCPWDRQQTHRSLRQGFQEEAHEVLDALDRDDLEALQEELGDVLLHILLQAQIASELGEFRMSDVICRVNTKIVYRHPHVFSGLDVDGVEQVLINWETLKQQEKNARTESPSALDGISQTMPSLARAQSIQRHVDLAGVLSAGTDELTASVIDRMDRLAQEGDAPSRAHTLGDLLFDLTNLARRLGIDAEGALREANARFEQQFRAMEHEIEN